MCARLESGFCLRFALRRVWALTCTLFLLHDIAALLTAQPYRNIKDSGLLVLYMM